MLKNGFDYKTMFAKVADKITEIIVIDEMPKVHLPTSKVFIVAHSGMGVVLREETEGALEDFDTWIPLDCFLKLSKEHEESWTIYNTLNKVDGECKLPVYALSSESILRNLSGRCYAQPRSVIEFEETEDEMYNYRTLNVFGCKFTFGWPKKIVPNESAEEPAMT